MAKPPELSASGDQYEKHLGLSRSRPCCTHCFSLSPSSSSSESTFTSSPKESGDVVIPPTIGPRNQKLPPSAKDTIATIALTTKNISNIPGGKDEKPPGSLETQPDHVLLDYPTHLDERDRDIEPGERTQAEGQAKEEKNYPHGPKLYSLILATCLAVFLVALDQTIIAPALGKITEEFGSVGDIGWYGSAYLLSTTALQPIYGSLYRVLDVKIIYLIAIGLFEAGSLVCAIAQSSLGFIVGRGVAGMGSAGLFAGSITILSFSLPLRRRSMAFGVLGGMWGVASIAAPLLGGLLASTPGLGWRWCFYINLPLGAISVAIIVFVVHLHHHGDSHNQQNDKNSCRHYFHLNKHHAHSEKKDTGQPTTPNVSPTTPEKNRFINLIRHDLDVPGSVLLIASIVSLLFALQWGGSLHPWSSPTIIVLFILFAILAVLFAVVQARRGDSGTIPPRLAREGRMLCAMLYCLCFGGGFVGLVYYVSLYFHLLHPSSAFVASMYLLPLLLATVTTSLLSGFGISYMLQRQHRSRDQHNDQSQPEQHHKKDQENTSSSPCCPSSTSSDSPTNTTATPQTTIPSVPPFLTPSLFPPTLLFFTGLLSISLTFAPTSSLSLTVPLLLLTGFSIGPAFQVPLAIVQSLYSSTSTSSPSSSSGGTSRSFIPNATAALKFSESLGGAIGIALASTVFKGRLVSGIDALGIQGLTGEMLVAMGPGEVRGLVLVVIADAEGVEGMEGGAVGVLAEVTEVYVNAIRGAWWVCLGFVGGALGWSCALGLRGRRIEKRRPHGEVEGRG